MPALVRWCSVLLLTCAVGSLGCRADGTSPHGDDGGRLDAGPTDAGPLPDTGPDTGRDAGPGDAGPSCPCPTLPTVCTPPAVATPVFSPSTGFGDELMQLLACADTSIHMAVYETLWDCVPGAIAARLEADADLMVQIVIDDDQCPRVAGRLDCAWAALDGHPRVSIVDDSRSNLMHHKFVIVDGARVWVSSANLTTNSFCSDFNNSIIVDQPEIVAGYEAQFDRMHNLGGFGPVAPTDPIRGGVYALYFSPETPLSMPSRWFADMVATIDASTTSIEFMISAFTRTEVSDALIAAHGRGVRIQGIIAGAYAGDAPAMALQTAGVDFRIDNVHHKVMIVDGHLVLTGSPNWSQASWANNEASLWIDDATIAGAYAAELDRVYMGARLP